MQPQPLVRRSVSVRILCPSTLYPPDLWIPALGVIVFAQQDTLSEECSIGTRSCTGGVPDGTRISSPYCAEISLQGSVQHSGGFENSADETKRSSYRPRNPNALKSAGPEFNASALSQHRKTEPSCYNHYAAVTDGDGGCQRSPWRILVAVQMSRNESNMRLSQVAARLRCGDSSRMYYLVSSRLCNSTVRCTLSTARVILL
jgi:hypothetical protein